MSTPEDSPVVPDPSDAPEASEAPRPRRAKKPQSLKPATAATKLDIYLPATPAEFQERMITRTELDELQQNPPQWLTDLRRNGPHPRSVVAARLRVSHSALVRNGLTAPQTTEQIEQILADAPEWLGRERASLAEVRRQEQARAERTDS
ncbi:DUF5997 family protein [Actinotalea sp.]|uniref:DUF5997 family protein n=1 Tax=Actinotalea sp. TaxID=1872145 RepID=UPI0035628AB6